MSKSSEQSELSVVNSKEKADECVSEKKLRQLYCEMGLSIEEIRKRLSIGRGPLSDLFDEYGINKRSSHEQYCINNDTRYRNKDFLIEMYIENEKSMGEIAEMCDCSNSTISNWLEKHDIDKREEAVDFWLGGRETQGLEYPMLTKLGCSEVRYLFEHHLVMIAQGCDPEKVFGDNKYNVHHRNGHKCDNRPSNLEMVNRRKHGKKHSHKTWNKWSDDDLEYAINFMLDLASNHPELN